MMQNFQTFSKLRTRNTLPLRTEFHTGYWAREKLPHEWSTIDEFETFHVVNNFTRQRMTIAIPWSHFHFILLSNESMAEL